MRTTSRGLLLLVVWLCGIYILEENVGRVTPPGGLIGIDYFFMLLIPGGAMHIAHWCSRRWVVLLYGGAASLLFVPGYLQNGRLGLAIGYGYTTARSILWGWIAFVAASIIICALVGEMMWRAKSIRGWIDIRQRRRQRGLCPECGYDLRASKDRCPECGMPISSKPLKQQ